MPYTKTEYGAPSESGPAAFAAAITPSDSVNMDATRGVYVGGTGTIVAIVGGTAITFTNAQAGSILPIRATRVNATSTTATGLIALY